jgi:Putative Flp pilus-assembly TadE/G-like
MAITNRRRSEGQIMVLFALLLVAMVAGVGLVIDGGSASAQRRGQQNAADLSALAGADALINGRDPVTAATTTATNNGYTASADVQVAVCVASGCSPSLPAGHVRVDIGAPHQNGFAAVVGQATWRVGVTATAVGWSRPDTATGALPLLFPGTDFGDPTLNDNVAIATYGDSGHPFTWTHGTSTAGDAPADEVSVAWTNFQLKDNVDTSRVASIIHGSLVVSVTAQFNDYLGQHNDGEHAALFGDIAAMLPADGSGMNFVVPIVSTGGGTCSDLVHTDGCFLGWATIHIISASQGGKSVTGYFVSQFSASLTYSGGCTLTTCPKNLGTYSLALTN